MYSSRIYTYKITFEEVPYYYYGVHKEKKFDEYYMGSPITHKWCWDFYTPKKQILQLFEFSDEGWLEANEIEQRLIKPVYNIDKWCLNGNCGGYFSLNILRENGKKVGEKYSSFSGKKGGKKAKKLGLGIHALTTEQRSENSKKYSYLGRETQKILGVGIYSMTTEQKRESGKKSAQTNQKNKTGLYGFTSENRREYVKITNSQRWECCETGYVSTAAGVVQYQKGKGIDTSKKNRKRVS
jgi:hypothetical protein